VPIKECVNVFIKEKHILREKQIVVYQIVDV